ncbi:alpha/beta-hydrolase [Testicularia cyperi]|uniref:Alpha/beta-hydrolase n=1 Tax=Testicularia cyperi TaxID=1882483 RepID=A0A317XHC7_9BASI|nr:alpha/beta-hydrolase [Testicularia cyperi]
MAQSIREDVKFASQGELCAGWLYRPQGSGTSSSEKQPAIVLGHGLGAVKEMKLDAYASVFSAAGYVCLCFDYRHFGESTGRPRQLLDISKQLEDWQSALDYISSLEFVDNAKIGIFGSSFGGGHVITTPAKDKRVKAVISQCPFTVGLASAATLGLLPLLRVGFLAIRDILFSRGDSIVPVKLGGNPGETALMNAPDVHLYKQLVPEGHEIKDYVAARIGLHIGMYNPEWQAKDVDVPIFFAICGKDSVAPPGPTLRFAKQAPKATVRHYPDMGHFDIYLGENFDKVTA